MKNLLPIVRVIDYFPTHSGLSIKGCAVSEVQMRKEVIIDVEFMENLQ
jgi:hypothetical protein